MAATKSKPADPERLALELAIVRAELGLLEEKAGDLGEDGTVIEEGQAYVEAYVYGSVLDKVAYYLVLAAATAVALVSVIGAITNMTKFTKSSEVSVVDQHASLEIPQMRFCTEFFSPVWTVETVCIGDQADRGHDCYYPEKTLDGNGSPTHAFAKTATLSNMGGSAGGITYEGSLNKMAGTNFNVVPVVMTHELEIHGTGAYTERFCVVQEKWRPVSTEHNFVTNLVFQLMCNPDVVDCSLATDEKGVPTNSELQSPVLIGSIYVGDGPKHFVDVISGDVVAASLTKKQVEFTDEEGSKKTTVDYTPEFMSIATSYKPFDWFFHQGFFPRFNAPDGPHDPAVRMNKAFSFASKMSTSLVTVSSTIMVPVGDFGAFYAALGGASSTVALLIGLAFGRFDVPKKNKKTGKSIDAYIGRWRRNPTRKARQEKEEAISKICREHYGLEYAVAAEKAHVAMV
jgi:hypothetical protein